ncbi:Nitrogen permease reactivator protein [Bulinus truncatus]|nr:Nitrogen permease reactivator protein [Bulinus truncatus]
MLMNTPLHFHLAVAAIGASLSWRGALATTQLSCYQDEPLNIIKVGIILPYHGSHHWTMPLVHPAIEIAWDKVMAQVRRFRSLAGYTVVIRTADSECSETIGPLAAINMYINRAAHVFFGPACEYSVAPVARFSYSWGIPVLSAGALVTAFKNKAEYKLLTRVQGTHAKVSEFILNIFRKFSWRHLGLLYHDVKQLHEVKKSCFFSIEAVFHDFLAAYHQRPFHKDFDDRKTDNDYASILREVSNNARGLLLDLVKLTPVGDPIVNEIRGHNSL